MYYSAKENEFYGQQKEGSIFIPDEDAFSLLSKKQDGGTIIPDENGMPKYVPKDIILPTEQEQRDAISNAIQKLLDDKAMLLRYDSILSARSYAGYANPFQTEALKLADWAANCWATAGSIEAQVNAGTMTMPTVDQALAMMPAYI